MNLKQNLFTLTQTIMFAVFSLFKYDFKNKQKTKRMLFVSNVLNSTILWSVFFLKEMLPIALCLKSQKMLFICLY